MKVTGQSFEEDHIYEWVPWGQVRVYVWDCDDILSSYNFIKHLHIFLMIFSRLCLSFMNK